MQTAVVASTVDCSSVRTLRGAFAILRNIIHNVPVKVPPTSNILPQEQIMNIVMTYAALVLTPYAVFERN